MAWESLSTSPYPWSSSTHVSKRSSKRSAPPEFSSPSMKARPAPAGKCVPLKSSIRKNIHPMLTTVPFSLNVLLEAPNGNAAQALWDTTRPPRNPPTANQRWVTSLPPRPLPQPRPRSVGVTLTWTASRTSHSHSGALLEIHLEVTDRRKEAVGVNLFFSVLNIMEINILVFIRQFCFGSYATQCSDNNSIVL